MGESVLGVNGERSDPVTGITHSGNGYRAYAPVLMRFNGPDGMSPFGAGGMNPYAYCAGDPVNRADPSGHFSIGGAIGIAAGILGVLFTPVTGGTSLGATMSVIAALAGVASVGLSIASEVVKEPGTASILGWSGMALGMVSGIGAGVLSKLAPESVSVAGKLTGFVTGSTRATASTETVTEQISLTLMNKSEATLDSVVQAAYPIERRIMRYLDTASVHNLRQTSKAFGGAADREMAFRMRTPEAGIPEPIITRSVVYRQYSPLPFDELERVLADDEFANSPVMNPEFLTWARKNMLGLGRSRPISFNDPVPLYSSVFAVWDYDKYQLPSTLLSLLEGNYWKEMLETLSAKGMTPDLISDNWNKLNRGFWVGF